MSLRRGQIAIYLIMVLVAIALLMLSNVSIFLVVRSKNRLMNAVDAAALAAAKHQGWLLNRVGEMNVAHLRAAVLGKPWEDKDGNDLSLELRRMVLMGPIDAIAEANVAAKSWLDDRDLANVSPVAKAGYTDHINEIKNTPDLYPRKDDDVWGQYAEALEKALNGNAVILPQYMEMANPGTSGWFASSGLYTALRAGGPPWCWFTIGNRREILSMDLTQPLTSEIYPVEVPENSEIFSLHVTFMTWMDSDWADEYVEGVGFSDRWTNFVCRVTGLGKEDFAKNSRAADPGEIWAFYDGNWGRWSKTFNPDKFPIAGTVKPEYDVAGCVASCMFFGGVQRLEGADGQMNSDDSILVTAEAKPLGMVEDFDGGGMAPVTAYNRFIAASQPGEQIFTKVGLVLMGSVPRSPGVSMAPDWFEHVKKHGPNRLNSGCSYCQLWQKLINQQAVIGNWVNANENTCRPVGGEKTEKGGYEYAH